MKTITALTVGLLTFQVSANQPLTAIDWQQTISQVKQLQTNKLVDEQPRRLTYQSHLFGAEFEQEFLFNEDGALVNVLYYQSLSAEGNNCTSQYTHFKTSAVKQLGETKTETYGKGIDCKAASIGTYKLYSQWTKENTQATLKLDTWKGTPYIGLSLVPATK